MGEAKTGTRLTGSEILWATLEGEGVREVFGYPGGAILPAYDALKGSNIHHILVRHEQGATHMADGYARASGRVGVAVATSGPAVLSLTAIGEVAAGIEIRRSGARAGRRCSRGLPGAGRGAADADGCQ